jgi:hypothetical protein
MKLRRAAAEERNTKAAIALILPRAVTEMGKTSRSEFQKSSLRLFPRHGQRRPLRGSEMLG